MNPGGEVLEMRRWIVALLVLALTAAPLGALAAGIDEGLIDDAKQALTLMSYGEYKKALKKLNLKEAPSAQELSDFVDENLSDVYQVAVQSEVAVAYQVDGAWRVAVPVEIPSYDSVQTLVVRAKDGKRFDAYRAMAWYEVMDQVSGAEQVIWQDAYEQDDIYQLPDD